jgi:hypothetical protein
MRMQETEAIETALEAYRHPHAVRTLKRGPIPAGMLTLIKLAAASPEEVEKLVTEETARQLPLREAAAFYLQQLLISAGNDYRQLGLAPGASLQEVKDHKRWLLKWLHPDRNRNSWESALFKRVVASAERLESALREGVQPLPAQKTRRHRKPKRAGSWQVAQRRVKQAVGWRSRLLKAAMVAAAIIVVVALAQLALAAMQGTMPSFALSRQFGQIERIGHA